jgi:hypothetical protein
MWALAKQGMVPEERLLNALYQQTVVVSKHFKPSEVVELMWALATLNVEPTVEIIEAMLCQSELIVMRLKLQDVYTLMWALACLGLHHKVQFSSFLTFGFLNHLLSKHVPVVLHHAAEMFSSMNDELFCQIHGLVISSHIDNFFPQLRLSNLLGSDFINLCRDTVQTRICTKSDHHLSISKCLLDLGIPFTENFLQKQTGYTIDFLLMKRNGEQLAIDLDDSARCVKLPDGRWQPSGPSLFKRRLMMCAGLRIVVLPFWKWVNCRNRSEQEACLRNLIYLWW